MSDNLPTNVQLESNASGTVSFAPEVIATIAGVATTEVEGVASMYAGSTGLADIFTRKSASAKSLTKGVRVDFADKAVSVEVAVIVDYGTPIPDVSLGIQENVKKAIETMSGLPVSNVNVYVQGLSFERSQKAIEEEQRQRLEAEKVISEVTKETELHSEEPAAAGKPAEPETVNEDFWEDVEETGPSEDPHGEGSPEDETNQATEKTEEENAPGVDTLYTEEEPE